MKWRNIRNEKNRLKVAAVNIKLSLCWQQIIAIIFIWLLRSEYGSNYLCAFWTVSAFFNRLYFFKKFRKFSAVNFLFSFFNIKQQRYFGMLGENKHWFLHLYVMQLQWIPDIYNWLLLPQLVVMHLGVFSNKWRDPPFILSRLRLANG